MHSIPFVARSRMAPRHSAATARQRIPLWMQRQTIQRARGNTRRRSGSSRRETARACLNTPSPRATGRSIVVSLTEITFSVRRQPSASRSTLNQPQKAAAHRDARGTETYAELGHKNRPPGCFDLCECLATLIKPAITSYSLAFPEIESSKSTGRSSAVAQVCHDGPRRDIGSDQHPSARKCLGRRGGMRIHRLEAQTNEINNLPNSNPVRGAFVSRTPPRLCSGPSASVAAPVWSARGISEFAKRSRFGELRRTLGRFALELANHICGGFDDREGVPRATHEVQNRATPSGLRLIRRRKGLRSGALHPKDALASHEDRLLLCTVRLGQSYVLH